MLLGKEEITPNASLKSFENATIQLLPNVTRLKLSTDSNEDDNEESENVVHGAEWLNQPENLMYLSYQDSLRICLSKIHDPGTGVDHTYD